MDLFLLNILLAVLWMFMWGSFDLLTFLVGLFAGYLLLGTVSRVGGRGYGGRVWRVLTFFVYFVYILVKANFQVAKAILLPSAMSPRIVRYDAGPMSDGQLTTFSNAISLTPGTLVIEVETDPSDRRRTLYVHAMFAGDRDAAIKDLADLQGRLRREVFA